MEGTFSQLHTFLSEHYSLEEIKTLCADLQLDYDALPGEAKPAKARELILWLARRHQLADLLQTLQQERPKPFEVAGLSQDVGQLSFEIFQDGSASLTKHIRIREFRRLVRERSRGFVGRDFIFQAIDQKLAEPTFASGYIHIWGEPGIGKTALMAELVRRRGYMHHFNIAPQNIRYPRQFLANLCAQLIVHYGLFYQDLPSRAVEDSGFLSDLLETSLLNTAGKPLVILVDALDEVDQDEQSLDTRRNVLYLPPTLPDNVYFIVTSRPKVDLPLRVDRKHDIYLDEDDPDNIADIQAYIEQYRGQNDEIMNQRLEEWGVTEATFNQILTEKSQGNFMYLEYVLRDISSGHLTKQTIHNVKDLPGGLRAYYHEHWRIMQQADSRYFKQIYEPVACFLAAAQEPVTITMLAEWSGLSPRQVRRVLNDWYQFFNVDKDAQPPLYRIYHGSFQEFLREDIGLTTYHAGIFEAIFS